MMNLTLYYIFICILPIFKLSWYGPGSVPLFEIGDTISEIKLLKSLDWSQYGIVAAGENSMLWEGEFKTLNNLFQLF